MTVKIQMSLIKIQEEIDPLEISFSNDKGFEPSTPSQTSPPVKANPKMMNLHIRNPIELFDSYTAKPVFPQRHFTPPSRIARVDVTKFASTSKKDMRKQSSLTKAKSWMQNSYLLSQHEKRRKELLKWQSVQFGHIRQITRIDSLLSRVQKNISLYSKLYPRKRY